MDAGPPGKLESGGDINGPGCGIGSFVGPVVGWSPFQLAEQVVQDGVEHFQLLPRFVYQFQQYHRRFV